MYRRSQKQICCLLKIDLNKAYDTVIWEFLEEMLMALRFFANFVKLVMTCVTSHTFSLMVNKCPTGFFKSKRGLRQRDPTSPLVLVLCIEYLSRTMSYIGKQPSFGFHPRCKSLGINHLCVADDLILFSNCDYKSASVLLQGVDLSAATTGLKPNFCKSAFFSYGMEEYEIQRMQDIYGLCHGLLPFR